MQVYRALPLSETRGTRQQLQGAASRLPCAVPIIVLPCRKGPVDNASDAADGAFAVDVGHQIGVQSVHTCAELPCIITTSSLWAPRIVQAEVSVALL